MGSNVVVKKMGNIAAITLGGVGEHCYIMEHCCERNSITSGAERGCRKSIAEIRVLHLLHLFFLFLCNYRSSFFVFTKLQKKKRTMNSCSLSSSFSFYFVQEENDDNDVFHRHHLVLICFKRR